MVGKKTNELKVFKLVNVKICVTVFQFREFSMEIILPYLTL